MADLSAFPITKRWAPQNSDLLQLYSFPTPNGVKVSIMLEETGIPYEPHKVTLADADVKSPAFLSLNPNNKIPAIIDPDGPDGTPVGIFESGAILIYLADKAGKATREPFVFMLAVILFFLALTAVSGNLLHRLERRYRPGF